MGTLPPISVSDDAYQGTSQGEVPFFVSTRRDVAGGRMNQNLDKLMKLQEIDSQIHDLDVSSEQFPVQVAAMEREMQDAQNSIDELLARMAQIAKDKGSAEDAMEESRQAVERSQSRLTTIRTNREYDALHSEIETNENSIASGKSRLGSLENEREQTEQAVAEARKALEELKAKNEPTVAELKSKIAAIDGRRDEFLAQRKAVAAETPPQFLRAYEHIQKRRKTGKVLSFANADSRTCSACHKVLEPQVVNEIRSAKRLSICQSCGSILIWQDGTPQVQ
jgi:predicted  nucleic acid-binding Zn-ribbon protein